jgi:peptide/nickel transport system permease protein
MALPLLVLALAVLVAVPASRTGVVVALSVGFTPLILRTTRASALAIKESGFVESANAVGASDAGIIWRHILPNVAGPWIIVAGAGVGTAILAESALSFLGLGAPISNPTLGSLLGGDAQNYIHRAPWLVLWPGVVISVLVLSVNLVAESYAESSATMRSRIASPGSGK